MCIIAVSVSPVCENDTPTIDPGRHPAVGIGSRNVRFDPTVCATRPGYMYTVGMLYVYGKIIPLSRLFSTLEGIKNSSKFMNMKSLITSVLVGVVALIVYNLAVKKLLKIDTYELNYEQD